LMPGPIVALNRAVVLGEVEGPDVALRAVDAIEAANSHLSRYHLLHVVRADLLRRLGRADEAAAAYQRALSCSTNQVESVFLQQNLDAVGRPD